MGVVHSGDAILVGFCGRVVFVYQPIVSMFFIRLDFIICLLIVTAVISIHRSLGGLAVKESMSVNSKRPASHVLKVDFNSVSYFSFYYWAQEAEVWGMGPLLSEGPICVLSIQHLLVLGGQPSGTSLTERYGLAVKRNSPN